MRSLSRLTVVSLTCFFCAIGTVAGGDLASGAPSGAQLQLIRISPTAGPLAGGNAVTIRAHDAADVTSVDFGTVTGGQIRHDSAHQLRVVAPAHDAGDVDIVLHSSSATSQVNPAGRYQFVAAPTQLDLQVSQRLGSPLGVGLLDAIGCTAHDFCAVEMRNRTGHVTALATFGDGHRTRVQQLPDNPVIGRPDCGPYCGYVPTPLIACGTPKFCVVGNRLYLREWNGHRWAAPIRLGGTIDSVLSCAPGTRMCVLGADNDSVVHDRHGWRTVAFPKKFPYPTSLSCATARFCVAASHGPTARFDGTSWHLVGARRHIPNGIGCASAHYCLAVGRGHAAVFDRTGWHRIARAPLQVKVKAVSCVAVGRCTAATRFAAETFASGHWSTSATPLEMTGFACVPHGICRATFANGQTLRFAHRHWTHTENITAYHDRLTDISCASPAWCMAVSRSGEAFRYANGAWSREGHVDGRHRLVAINCTADQVCVAVDGADGNKKDGPFSGGGAVRYAHGRWHRRMVIDTSYRLTDVSCATAEHCVAVDMDGRAVTYRNGTWSDPTPLAQEPKRPIHLTWSVDCPTIHYCATAGRPSYELVDGAWREIPDGLPSAHGVGPLEYARGVDCVDPSYCVFGDISGVEIRNHGVIGSAYLCCVGAQAVSCPSRSYCAVVFDNYYGIIHRTLLMNGAAHRRDERLTRSGRPGAPAGIACFAGPVCIGVTDARGFVGS